MEIGFVMIMTPSMTVTDTLSAYGFLKLSDLDAAMSSRMAYIVIMEKRPFSYHDFLVFEESGKTYKVSHGTYRNKISALIKTGEVIRLYNSGIGFYSLPGFNFLKLVTPDHALVHNDPLYKLIQNLPVGKQSIHDIRLKFKIPDIWKIVSVNPNFTKAKRSGDIVIPSWNNGNTIIRTLIHKTNTVSVIVGCSLCPIPLDTEGIINFFALLVRVEEQLKTILNNQFFVHNKKLNFSIPDYKQWTVTMWHFGRDSLIEYNGERFSITIEKAQDILVRAYTKNTEKGKKRIRLEKQEYPMKSIEDAIEDKLK